jgi:hypothetical protein
MVLGLPDPVFICTDPVIIGTDPDLDPDHDPSINKLIK